MTFKDALHLLSTNLILKIALPDWASNLTEHTRNINLAFKELKVCYSKLSNHARVIHISCLEQQYMVEMVEARRNADKVEQHHDLFSSLLDAAQDEPDNRAALNEEELMGKYIIALLEASYSSSQETCLYFFLPDMRWDPPLLPAVLFQNGSLQTAAHTLCFSFALLALYPNEQERLYQHINGVMSSLDGTPVSSRNLNL